MSAKILFVCKRRPANYGSSYGLLNSCRFLCNALNKMGNEANLVEVIDNNYIDREVTKYKPTHVFIEALWVVPDKFDVLLPLHKDKQWFVRLHSNTAFIANEGIAMDWIIKYHEKSKKYPFFHISPNSSRFCHDLMVSLNIPTIHSPNIYYPDQYDGICKIDKDPSQIHVGSFGAIRPLKNQLIQAMASIKFADDIQKILYFHINHARLEQNGENVYKNIRAIFKNSKHYLVEHDWLSHKEFIYLINLMDLGLQISFSETFNIVAADFVGLNIPIIVSSEVSWANWLFKTSTTDIDKIVGKMKLAYYTKKYNLHKLNNLGLKKYNNNALITWHSLLQEY